MLIYDAVDATFCLIGRGVFSDVEKEVTPKAHQAYYVGGILRAHQSSTFIL
jgi:hypothetical protein